MMLFLLFLPLFVFAADKCSTIPSDFWCGNAEIEQSCGFKELCNRYRTATQNKPIRLTLFMEAFCPGCQAFIIGTLYPSIYKNFAGFVEFEIVPFGNARIINGTIVCQHGEEECFANKFESCLIDSVQKQDVFVPYLFCLESLLQQGTEFQPATQTCFEKLKIGEDAQRLVQSCLVSELGNQLQKKAAERTLNVWPEEHQWVPWIMINDVSLTSLQLQQGNLPALLCKWWTGTKKIPYCQDQKKKMRKNFSSLL